MSITQLLEKPIYNSSRISPGDGTGAGSNVSYGNDAQNFGVAGGGGGENYNTGFGTTGGNDFAASGGDAGAN